MADEFIVQSAIPERLYVKIYHDFLDSELLNGKEKLVFILLKRYVISVHMLRQMIWSIT